MTKILKLPIIIVPLLLSCMVFLSCSSNKGNANMTMDTQFSVTVNDSIHLLSPKTYSHLKNINPPLGLVPVVVTVDSIADKDMGTFADDKFDEYCEKDYIGGTFEQRGILLVVSRSPRLIQVRVGGTYSVYCRMRGSTAGGEYLKMQKSVEERGVDEMCPIVLANTIADIEDCRNLPFYKKAFFKMIFSHIEIFMDDLATPSESFFNQIYFKPFIYVISVIHGLVRSWWLAFFVICGLYFLGKKLIGDWTYAMMLKRIQRTAASREDMMKKMQAFEGLQRLAGMLLKFVVTVPTLGAITVLSTSRTEDIIALDYYHIPYTDVLGTSMHWDNSAPILWTILLLMMVYYLKFLFCERGLFTFAHFPDAAQSMIREQNGTMRAILDNLINKGYNRILLQRHVESVAKGSVESVISDNTAIESTDDSYSASAGADKDSQNWINGFFLNSDSETYRKSPYLAIMINTHREALSLAFVMGVVAAIMLSSTYIVFFLVLWTVSLLFRLFEEYMQYRQIKNPRGVDWSRLFRRTWVSLLVFFVLMLVVLFFMLPVYSAKQYEKIDVSAAIPEDVTGLYFVQKSDGIQAKGVTARIRQDDSGALTMYVYSDEPVMKYVLDFDRQKALFYNEFLGTGYIVYDKETRQITINFSDKWVLTN